MYIPFPDDNNSMAYMYYKNIINIRGRTETYARNETAPELQE